MEHNNACTAKIHVSRLSISLWPLDSGVQINDSHRRVVMTNQR